MQWTHRNLTRVQAIELVPLYSMYIHPIVYTATNAVSTLLGGGIVRGSRVQ